jgi:hypothetical protein
VVSYHQTAHAWSDAPQSCTNCLGRRISTSQPGRLPLCGWFLDRPPRRWDRLMTTTTRHSHMSGLDAVLAPLLVG